MKLQPLAIVVFLMSPTSAANCSPRHCRTLPATAKKPASLAGFLFLKLNLTLRFALFLSLAPTSLQPHLLNLITQTPNSF